MHDNEVVLHALYDLAQAAHDLLVHTTTPIPLALHTQLRHEHTFCLTFSDYWSNGYGWPQDLKIE